MANWEYEYLFRLVEIRNIRAYKFKESFLSTIGVYFR